MKEFDLLLLPEKRELRIGNPETGDIITIQLSLEQYEDFFSIEVEEYTE